MGNYKLGQWTKSTLETLNFIVKSNLEGKKLKITDIQKLDLHTKGTIINWIYVLKRPDANYVDDSNGVTLTPKGYELLKELKDNPPSDRRGHTIRRKRKSVYTMGSATQKNTYNIKPKIYKVRIEGNDLVFEMILSEEKAKEIIKALSEIRETH